MELWSTAHTEQKARLAELTGSVWAGCGDEFLTGAVAGLAPDLPSVTSDVSFEIAEEVALRTGRSILAQMIKARSLAVEVAAAAAHGYVASAVCRSQNERPMENPEKPGFDDDGRPISVVAMQGGAPAPGKVTVQQMKDLIDDSQRHINGAISQFHIECLSKL